MVRRTTARLVLRVALITMSLAWAGFVALHTVFDAGRTDRIVDVALTDPATRVLLTDQVITQAGAMLPTGTVTDTELRTVAEKFLDDPRSADALRVAVRGTHGRLLGDDDSTTYVDTAGSRAAARDALVSVRPDLDTLLPADVPVPIVVPPVPDLSPMVRFVTAVTPLLATAGLVFAGGAVVVAADRGWALRRLGRWAVVAGGGSVIVAAVVPRIVVAAGWENTGAACAAFAAALLGDVLPAAIMLCVAGIAGYIGGRVLSDRLRASARS